MQDTNHNLLQHLTYLTKNLLQKKISRICFKETVHNRDERNPNQTNCSQELQDTSQSQFASKKISTIVVGRGGGGGDGRSLGTSQGL